MSTRADDYLNNVTALGTAKDKSNHTGFADAGDLSEETLDAIYEKHSIGRRVVDRVVDDATRVDFSLTGTDENFDWDALKSELDDLEAVPRLADAWRWARLYGGSIVIMAITDGMDLSKPAQIERARDLRSLEIVESRYATPQIFDKTLGARGFRNPEMYNVVLPAGKAGLVHRSRVIRFDGVRVPPTRLHARGGWGPSVLDQLWVDLRRLGSAMGYAEAIMHDISLMVLTIEGFHEKMASGEQDRNEMRAVFENMRWGLDMLNTMIMDSQDTYREQPRTVAGVSQLLDHFINAMVRATDMPRTVLLGEQPGGLNASADSEIRAWYDHVANMQQKVLTPALNKLIKQMFAIKARRGATVPTEWTIEWEPLWQPTDQEKAQAELVRAQAGQIRQTIMSVSAPDEERAKMIASGDIVEVDPAVGFAT